MVFFIINDISGDLMVFFIINDPLSLPTTKYRVLGQVFRLTSSSVVGGVTVM